ncbi:MAG: Polysulfide reductase, NrfD [Bacteroidetes bacterium]|nr:Polysulfide reductase, NrfD [Bacteroidota bacterium]
MTNAPPLVAPGNTYATVTEKVAGDVLTRPTPRAWFVVFGVAFLLVMVFLGAVSYLFARGVGIWGVRIPIAWGYAIVNFVWWIGIGHAGTLISAILLLLHQHWRNSINRFAEAMTLFAVACAGMFPILHLGRPWLFYWLFPFPNPMNIWPQFRSPLIWDVFAVSTYATISFVYWYVGMIPDLASMRDRAKKRWVQVVFGMLSLGWRGAARHWHRYETVYLLLAGLATPLVVSVHSVVSFDFAISILPGWHSTIFPPYFVAGAIYSGFAMVLTLVIPVRKLYGLEGFITLRHLDYMAKVMLATGLIVAYGYLMEAFFAWYSGNPYERFMMFNRAAGPYALGYWALILCNILLPQLLWIKAVRQHMVGLFVISIIVNIGMWLERFVIVITSLHRDFIPSEWAMYYPTIWDWATFFGTIGLFLALMFLFIRFLPMMSMFELRQLIPVNGDRRGNGTDGGAHGR